MIQQVLLIIICQRGKQQHYELGKWLRKRYSSLLDARYDREQVFVQSTDVDRTLMSAQSNLAGLYEPVGDDVWNPLIKWQPIPVHSVPEKDDPVGVSHVLNLLDMLNNNQKL